MVHNDKYKVLQGHECLSACLGGVLGYVNNDITPNAIIMLGNGMNVKYSQHDNILTSDIYEANFHFLGRYGVKYEIRKISNDCEETDTLLRAELDNGNIPILKLKSNNLSYNRVFLQAQNAIHYICLVGYEEEEYYILDNYVPSRIPSIYKGTIDKNNILEAFIASEGYYIIIKNVDAIRDIDITKDLKDAVMNSISSYVSGNRDSDYYYGQNAALKFFGGIINKGIANKRDELIQYNFQLKIYGFISLKYVLFDVLSGLIMCENSGQEEYYMKEFNSILEEWNNISIYMLKCGFAKKNENYQKLLERVILCNNTEIELLKGLCF